MVKKIKKDGFVYKSMNKHRIKLMIYIIIIAFFLVLYFMLFKPYITNFFVGPSPLNEDKFLNDYESVVFTEDDVINEDDDTTIKTYTLKGKSYWQQDSYEFKIKFSDVKKTDINYTLKNTSDKFDENEKDVLSACLYSAKIKDRDVFVIAYPHTNLTKIASGIFTEFPDVIKSDIYMGGNFNTEHYKYIFDVRGIEMEGERFDITLFIILSLILLFLFIKLIIYLINPYLTPTYREFSKYGDTESVIEDVEYQLKSAVKTKDKKAVRYITEDWIVYDDVFKLKLNKNHLKNPDNTRYGSKL